MLKKLKYSVQFPTTGRVFENQIVFEPGLTAIVGRNEAGKSLVVEMIRYANFGKDALRGKAEDYKSLSVDLEEVVNGKTIRIVREPKSEVLYVDGVKAAVGAAAINKAMPQILGFGLDVMDIALIAPQDELHALSKMRPADRARMVEKVTGEESLAATEKLCREQARKHNGLAEALSLMVREPVAPVKPEDYVPSEELYKAMDAVRDRNMQRSVLSQILKPVEPVAPQDPGLDEKELDQYQIARAAIKHQVETLTRQIAAIPEATYTLEEIAATEAYEAYRDEVARRGPRPEYGLDQLVAWELYYQAGDQVVCPKCNYTFGIADADIAVDGVEEPSLTLGQVREQLKRHSRWPDTLEEPTAGPIMNVTKEKVAYERVTERESLRHQLSEITIPVDLSSDLQRARDYNRNRVAYDERMRRYTEDLRAWEEAQAALQALGPSEDAQAIYQAWTASSRFEEDERVYALSLSKYEEDSAIVKTERDNGEGFKKGADALKLVRQQVKQELTPSLSREASRMLSAMTNGERNTVTIDEDFNVFADGQPLHTLSGSGKSVVNLAMRIGLGRVLTSRVFSIFIGDEVDHAMDSDRVGATQEMFRNLTQVLDQVILVTHKDISADHTISLS